MFHSLESQKIEMEQIEFLMRALTKPEWTGDWLGYCRTYLNRYGITNEVEVLSIAGNLEQVVKKMIAEEKEIGVKEEKERWINQKTNQHDEKIRAAERERISREIEGMKEKDEALLNAPQLNEVYNQALSDILSLLKN